MQSRGICEGRATERGSQVWARTLAQVTGIPARSGRQASDLWHGTATQRAERQIWTTPAVVSAVRDRRLG